MIRLSNEIHHVHGIHCTWCSVHVFSQDTYLICTLSRLCCISASLAILACCRLKLQLHNSPPSAIMATTTNSATRAPTPNNTAIQLMITIMKRVTRQTRNPVLLASHSSNLKHCPVTMLGCCGWWGCAEGRVEGGCEDGAREMVGVAAGREFSSIET